MPRPQRCRRICSEPMVTGFSPDDMEEKEEVVLTLDEYEVIRLVDLEKQTHEQCAKQMEVSRSTVTEIYENAREKIADSLVNGRRLTIGGGKYRLCDGNPKWCYKKHCEKQHSEKTISKVEPAALSADALSFNPDMRCSHLDHEHGGEFHACSDHGCGKHSCGKHSCR